MMDSFRCALSSTFEQKLVFGAATQPVLRSGGISFIIAEWVSTTFATLECKTCIHNCFHSSLSNIQGTRDKLHLQHCGAPCLSSLSYAKYLCLHLHFFFFHTSDAFFLFLFMLIDQGTEANTAFLGEAHSCCHTVKFSKLSEANVF